MKIVHSIKTYGFLVFLGLLLATSLATCQGHSLSKNALETFQKDGHVSVERFSFYSNAPHSWRIEGAREWGVAIRNGLILLLVIFLGYTFVKIAADKKTIWPVIGAIFLLVISLLVISLISDALWSFRLEVDRARGELTLKESGIFGENIRKGKLLSTAPFILDPNRTEKDRRGNFYCILQVELNDKKKLEILNTKLKKVQNCYEIEEIVEYINMSWEAALPR